MMAYNSSLRRPWYLGTRMVLTWGDPGDPSGETGLYDPISGQYLNNGSAQVDLITDETTGLPLAGVTFPLAMEHLFSSNGCWQVIMPGTETVTKDQLLKATLSAVANSGVNLVRYLYFTVVEA